MERACGKAGGNGEGEQESCGNGDKRPAGIAASREEWEDFVASQNQVTGRISGDPLPPFKPTWAGPPPLPPGVHTPPPAKDEGEASLGEITLQPLIRGRRP